MYLVKTKQFCLQRKPEEETHQGDNEAKKSKPEPAVNGGGGDAAPSGNEVAEKMEEEVGSWVRTLCIYIFFFPSPSVQAWFCAWFHVLLIILALLPVGLHRLPTRWAIFPSWQAACCIELSDTELGRCQLWLPAAKGGGQKYVLGFCMSELGWTTAQSPSPEHFCSRMLKGFKIVNLAYNCYCFRVVLGSTNKWGMHGYVLKSEKL